MWQAFIHWAESLTDAQFVALWILLCVPTWIAWDKLFIWTKGTHDAARTRLRERDAALERALHEELRRDIRKRFQAALAERSATAAASRPMWRSENPHRQIAPRRRFVAEDGVEGGNSAA